MLPTEFAQYAVVIVGGLSALSLTTAIARRIAGPRQPIPPLFGNKGAQQDVDVLREDVERLHGEVAELRSRCATMDEIQERLDFAERMLAQVRDKAALPPGPR